MTAQDLKNSILQRAIEGKLVPQRQEEGTAKELLAKIRAEKARLIKEKKIKKSKPLPAITDDEKPFDIPESWEWVRMGSLLDIIGGTSYKKNQITTNGLRILRGGNINTPEISLYDDDVFLPLSFSDAEKLIRKGDILIVASTGSKKVIGKPAFVYKEYDNISIGAFLRICRLFYTKIFPYITLIFSSEYYRNHIRESVQGTNINNMKKEYILDFLIPLPPLAEQRRIVAKIEELLPDIDAYDKAQTKVQSIEQRFPGAMKKSLLQYAIEGKLVPQRQEEGTAKELLAKIRAEKARLIKEKKIKKSKPLPEITDAEKPFDIPESWEWVRLTDLCANIVDCPHSTPKYFTSNTGYYAIDTNVIDSSGKLTGWRYVNQQSYLQRITRLTPKHGDVVLTREGSIGRAAILPSNKKICLGQRVMLLRPSAYVDAKFIKTILMAPSTLIRLTIRQKGLGAKHINVSDVCNLVLPLPPLAEQHRIVARLEDLLPLCDALAAQL